MKLQIALSGLLGLASLGLMSQAAWAQKPNASGKEWTVGLGLIQTQTEFKGVDAKVLPVPLVFYQGENWAFTGLGVEYSMALSSNSFVYATAKPRLSGYDQKLSPITKDMATRQHSLDAGFGYAYFFDYGIISAEWLHDVLAEHKGQESRLSYSLPIELNHWVITPSFTAVYYDQALVDYYYGVRSSEATDSRDAYRGKAATNLAATLEVTYLLSESWSLSIDATYQQLDKAIYQSPLISDKSTASFGAYALYSF